MTDPTTDETPDAPLARAAQHARARRNRDRRDWTRAALLFGATALSTLYVGAGLEGSAEPLRELWRGWVFSVPLLTILLSHELGHYVVGRLHGVDISPPYFIPIPFSLGTFGAVIQLRERVRSRNALMDIGAAGPIAGLVVGIPILLYGMHLSDVGELGPPEGNTLLEGHSILYEILLYVMKGPIAPGDDIHLSSTALAGWVGLLVTSINLVPFGQLDGGHIAFALFGPKQHRVSRWVLRVLPVLALGVSAYYAWVAAQALGHFSWTHAFAGSHWLVWAVLLGFMTRIGRNQLRRAAEDPDLRPGVEALGDPELAALHPPFDPGTLTPARKALGVLCLGLFVLLFMPSMMRVW